MSTSGQRDHLLNELRAWGGASPTVLAALARVPREQFVPAGQLAQAYDDVALPIAAGQTISQPRMVAEMSTACGDVTQGRVLEVGTGSGYQAAILSHLCREVVSIERIPELFQTARQRLKHLGIDNVECVLGDGSLGWPARAPYAAIVVTAGTPQIPWTLYGQLAPGGRLIVPVGEKSQRLLTITHTATGPRIETGVGCLFVPLVGQEGWPESAAESPAERPPARPGSGP